MKRPLKLLVAIVAVASVGAGCSSGGAGSSTLRDAATMRYTLKGEPQTLHVSRARLLSEVRSLVNNEKFAEFLKTQDFEVSKDLSASTRLTAIWLTQLIQQETIDSLFESRHLKVTAAQRAQAAKDAAGFFPGEDIFPAFSKEFQAGGLISRGAVLRSAYAQFVYLVGGADHDQMEKMRQFMSQLTAGWDVATVREIVAETLHHVVDPIVYDEAVSLIEEHRALGRDVVIVSTSGAEVVGPIGEMLGADDVIATQLEIVDGKYTGIIEYYAYAEEKARAIQALADERGYDLEGSFAYSDSVTDVPMLEAVGHPHAVNPDKELRRIAADRGWPILVFTKPVTLGSRLPPARSALAALAVGGVGAVGWALWASARRRRLGA